MFTKTIYFIVLDILRVKTFVYVFIGCITIAVFNCLNVIVECVLRISI